jgi:hypothetical protein
VAGKLENSAICFGFFKGGSGGGGGGGGIWGISDAAGTYTYYDTIALANAAASSGDTIELFADVDETNAVEWVLKDGVIYNMNGHTYTLNVATTEDAVTDDNVAGTFRIMNGTIARRGGTASNSNSQALRVENSSTELLLESVECNSDFGMVSKVNGLVNGGVFRGTRVAFSSQAHTILIQGGTLRNLQAYAIGCNAINCSGTIEMSNCYAYSQNTSAIFSNSSGTLMLDCVGETDTQYGIYANGSGTLVGCVGISTGQSGIYSRGKMLDCTGIGLAGSGINYLPTSAGSSMEGCHAFSSTAIALLIQNDVSIVKNCTASSKAGSAVQSAGYIYDCVFETFLGSSSAYAITLNTGRTTSVISGCTLKVANSSAYCIFSSATKSVNLLNNVYVGATTPVFTTNITNTQTNTKDSFGNIEVG